ncbi:hypothetical protein [Streptomyces avermitilis]|uniref:hypothetical protein n=1 Tax=Streptomyces avermitilis TaxID=33903 RepID=UPI0033BB880F
MTDPTRRALRTAIQALFAVAAALPLLTDSPGVADIPAFAALVAAATTFSRLMSVPAVERLLPDWLRMQAGADGEQ